MKIISRSLLAAALGLALLPCPAPGAQKKNGPDVPLTEWMQKYEAWDAYARELSRKGLTPEATLKPADALIRAGQPEQALKILDASGAFSDSDLEGRRLWLRARGLRHVSRFEESVLEFARAATLLGGKQAVDRMRLEPGLDRLLESVWIRLFWNNLAPSDPGLSQARSTILAGIMDLAAEAWPKQGFWKATRAIWPVQSATSPLVSSPNYRERELTAKGLAALALGMWDRSREYFSTLPNAGGSRFWLGLLASVQQNRQPDGASPFLDCFAPSMKQDLWVFSGPESSSWSGFLATLESMPPEKGLQLIRRESGSALISSEMRESLAVLEQAFGLLTGSSRSDVSALPQSAPVSLQAAAMLVQGRIPDKSNPETYGLLCALANAGGYAPYPAAQVPVPLTYDAVSGSPSLDLVGNYARLVRSTGNGDSDAAAKLAFLFPGTPGATDALLDLAGKAHKAGNPQRAWAYLNQIREDNLDGSRKTDFLLARAGLEMELGREDEAFATYKHLMETAPTRISADRKLKLAAMAQQKGSWKWAQTILEELNKNRSSLPRPLQAELLFWIGEGAQYQGDEAGALDAYLRLGWEYMDQNIWAVTAMYRAGLIYENQGNYATAKKVFETVLKHSDRKSQKEAATARIKSVEARMQTRSRGGAEALF